MKIQNIASFIQNAKKRTWLTQIHVRLAAQSMSDMYKLNSNEPFDIVIDRIHLFGCKVVDDVYPPRNVNVGITKSDAIGVASCLVKYVYTDPETHELIADKSLRMFKTMNEIGVKVGTP